MKGKAHSVRVICTVYANFAHCLYYRLCRFEYVLVHRWSIRCPFRVREAALVYNLHLFDDCRLSRLARAYFAVTLTVCWDCLASNAPKSKILHSFLNFLLSSSSCLSMRSERAFSSLSVCDAQLPIACNKGIAE